MRGAETRRRYLVILVAGCTARRSSGVMRVGERGSGPGVDLQRGTHEDRHQGSQYKPGSPVPQDPQDPGAGRWGSEGTCCQSRHGPLFTFELTLASLASREHTAAGREATDQHRADAPPGPRRRSAVPGHRASRRDVRRIDAERPRSPASVSSGLASRGELPWYQPLSLVHPLTGSSSHWFILSLVLLVPDPPGDGDLKPYV